MRYANGLGEVKVKPDALPVKIEFGIRRDIDAIVAIENESYDDPWTKRDLQDLLKLKNVILIVAKLSRQLRPSIICGFAVYQITDSAIDVLNLAVMPAHRRRWVGTQLVESLKARVGNVSTDHLRFPVTEDDLEAQLFAKATGLKAVNVTKGVPVLETSRNPSGSDDIEIEAAPIDETFYIFEWRPSDELAI